MVKEINLSEAFARSDLKILEREPKQVVASALANLKLKHLPIIRAKLAFLEVFSSCLIPEAVAHLVSICPKYLGTELIQRWLLKCQWEYRNAEDEAITSEAKRCLDLVFSSFKGDRRKNKTRIYDYWRCSYRYDSLNKLINALREKDLGVEFKKLGIIGVQYNIPIAFEDRITCSATSPAELALEIMTAQRDIYSPKAFRDFQSHTSKLRERHPELTSDPFVQNFLDYQFKHLESFNKTDIWSVLETL